MAKQTLEEQLAEIEETLEEVRVEYRGVQERITKLAEQHRKLSDEIVEKKVKDNDILSIVENYDPNGSSRKAYEIFEEYISSFSDVILGTDGWLSDPETDELYKVPAIKLLLKKDHDHAKEAEEVEKCIEEVRRIRNYTSDNYVLGLLAHHCSGPYVPSMVTEDGGKTWILRHLTYGRVTDIYEGNLLEVMNYATSHNDWYE